MVGWIILQISDWFKHFLSYQRGNVMLLESKNVHCLLYVQSIVIHIVGDVRIGIDMQGK